MPDPFPGPRPWRPVRALSALGVLAAVTFGTATAAAPPPDNGAVILMYHRFGEDAFPSTSIRIEQFEAHIRELTSGPFTVLPLPEIVRALQTDAPLPERTVGISIDDAFRSIYTEAWPRLRAAGLPFTIFVSTAALDEKRPGYMSWDKLREMAASGLVTVGNHSVRHDHMADLPAAEARAEIAQAAARFERELGSAPSLFAYPYGEYGRALRDAVAEAGFAAAFGQHSGAVARSTDRYALPRYALNETYGEAERFRLVVNSLPLPVRDVTPDDPLLRAGGNPPLYGFTVAEHVARLDAINCFTSGNEITMERLGDRRVEIRLARPYAPGRARINCTVPGPEGRWRWHGTLFTVLP